MESFDFVVVGGGSGGCAVASRLSEDPATSVALLEAGGADDNWVVNFNGDAATPLGSMLAVRIDVAQHHTLRGEAVA